MNTCGQCKKTCYPFDLPIYGLNFCSSDCADGYEVSQGYTPRNAKQFACTPTWVEVKKQLAHATTLFKIKDQLSRAITLLKIDTEKAMDIENWFYRNRNHENDVVEREDVNNLADLLPGFSYIDNPAIPIGEMLRLLTAYCDQVMTDQMAAVDVGGTGIMNMTPGEPYVMQGSLGGAGNSHPQPVKTASDFLQKADTIMRQRGEQYDKEGGERSMAQTVQAFNAITGQTLTETEGWTFMLILKQTRLYQNRESPHQDSCEDSVAYAALQAESAMKNGI